MDTTDIKKLTRDPLQNNLYDFFIQSFKNAENNLLYTVVTRKFEMRLDFLCKTLYGDIKYIGFLMKTNDIFNPFSIKYGDIIAYIPKNYLNDVSFQDPKTLNKQYDALVNKVKTLTIDKNRLDFLNNLTNKTNLPPVIAPDGSSLKNIVDQNAIIIAPTLFAENITGIGAANKTELGLSNVVTNNGLGNIFDNDNNNYIETSPSINTGSGTERILVRTFIKSGNTIISTTNNEEETNSENDNKK